MKRRHRATARRRPVRLLAASLLVGGLITAGCGSSDGENSAASSSSSSTRASTTSTTEPCAFSGGTEAQISPPGATTRLLTGVDIDAPGCVETVAFTFQPATLETPPGFDIAYASPPFRDSGSGREVTVSGDAFLVVRIRPAALADLDQPGAPATYTGPRVITPSDTTAVTEVAFFDGFEGQLAWVIGLDQERPFLVDAATDVLTITVGPA